MKTKGIAKLLMLYMAFCAHAAFGQNMDRPFGWACCSSETSADDYIVSGGSEKADTIVLVSNGQDMRTLSYRLLLMSTNWTTGHS